MDTSERDCVFVGGRFLDAQLPKEKQWLWKYFQSDLGRKFLTYYFTFGTHFQFVQHTGCVCTYRWRKMLKNKLDALLEVHQKARESGDFELCAEIETGNYGRTKSKE